MRLHFENPSWDVVGGCVQGAGRHAQNRERARKRFCGPGGRLGEQKSPPKRLAVGGDGFRASKTPARPESGEPSPESIVVHIEARMLVRDSLRRPHRSRRSLDTVPRSYRIARKSWVLR